MWGLTGFQTNLGRSGLTEVPTQVSAEDVGKGEQFQGQEHPKQTIKPRKHLETSGNTLKTRTTQKKHITCISQQRQHIVCSIRTTVIIQTEPHYIASF
jgi:hypothetical protein